MGAKVGRAAANNLALFDLFSAANLGYCQALALEQADGIGAEEFLPNAHSIRDILPKSFDELALRDAEGRHREPTSTIASVRSSLTHLVSDSSARELELRRCRGLCSTPPRPMTCDHGLDEVSLPVRRTYPAQGARVEQKFIRASRSSELRISPNVVALKHPGDIELPLKK